MRNPMLFCLVLLCFVTSTLQANVVINEILASNTTVNIDPDYNEYSDWVELYNSGSTAIDLSGFALTDNYNNLSKWKIPNGTTIAAKGYLLIWTDGNNAGLHTNFKLSSVGEELALADAASNIIDSITFGAQEPNISLGRKTDDITSWVLFTEPTPGSENSTPSFDGIVKSYPNFSVPGGVFNTNITLNISTLYGGAVRYTIDGSEPTSTSPFANGAITISKNTVVRARIFKTGMVPGPVATNSYFIDINHALNDLPIVSISTEPKNFWDPTVGIYVQDFKPDWEVPVNIELFETDSRDKAAFNLQAGIKVNGLYSWQLPQKMLGVYFKKEYGTSKLEYPLIFEKQRKVFDDFALRASGNDWSNTLFRDGMVQNSTYDYTNLDNSGFRACVVYVNGEYLGIHNIREKIDEDYIVGNHGLEPGTFDMVENEDFAETGDLTAYNYLLTLLAKDLTNQTNWNAVADEMDIEEFTDLICTEIYSGNSSVDHNVMAWKPKDEGKWKWVIMDLDRGFFNVNSHPIDFYINQSSWPYRELMTNDDYKKYFGIRLANHLYTTFNPERIKALIDRHANTIDAEIPNHIKRWEGTSSSYGDPIPSYEYWQGEVEKLRVYAEARPAVILNDLTNYGFEDPVSVTIVTMPANAGNISFNGMKIPVNNCTGGYPMGETIALTAQASAGYKFAGWQSNADSTLIAQTQIWKYYDKGTDLNTDWKNVNFSDATWSQGQAELGYGDGDENTIIDYGTSSTNKYITSYFRKNVNIPKKQNIKSLTLKLKCDDGAIIYLNGTEVQRYNMPGGSINYLTPASSNISGSDESDFHTYTINVDLLIDGNNVIAAEVHQSDASSNDISFDIELLAQTGSSGQFISTNSEYSFVPQADVNISAVFESDGKCIMPTSITSEVTLEKGCSPYVASSDIFISSTGKLTIEPGVEIWMSEGASIYSSGLITAVGTSNEPIKIIGYPNSPVKNWGFISIMNVADTSKFINVIIEDASRGERPREVGAITAYNSGVLFDTIHFDNISANPIATRFCKVTLKNSLLHSNIVGDLINVTRGQALIENCEFIGNYLPDNDAIDFNGGSNSILRNCIIRDFFGINNDAIDLGERASNIHIEGLYAHDITDKGLSIGQQSNAFIKNSLFTNCNLGLGVKDSSYAHVSHCTFYGVGTPIATYEKIAGRAGGNVTVTNSILSNAYTASYLCDPYSTIDISYSSSDNDSLPEGKHNIFANPQLTNPTIFDFSLKSNSPCIGTASDGNMGSGLSDTGIEPEIIISDIAYFTDPTAENLEFIGLYNPGDKRVDMSGYQFISGVTFTFPEGTYLDPNRKLFVSSNSASSFWIGRGARLYQWDSGKLADEGEDIQLTNEVGTMIDEVEYDNKSPWPKLTQLGDAISLSSFDVDNHFGENWQYKTQNDIVSTHDHNELTEIKVYPNPTNGVIKISGKFLLNQNIEIFNSIGINVLSVKASDQNARIDLSNFEEGLYLIKIGDKKQTVVLVK